MPNRPPKNFVLNRRSVQAQGLVGWWPLYAPFNAKQNTHIIDYSLYGSRVPIVSPGVPVYYDTEEFGPVTRFKSNPDTTEGYFDLPIVPYLPIIDPVTMVVWIKLEPITVTWANMGIMGIANAADYPRISLWTQSDNLDGTTTVTYELGADPGADSHLYTVICNHGWRHIVADWSAGRAKVWVDGVLVSNQALASHSLGLTTENWQLGGPVFANPPSNYSSCALPIAEFRIYSGISMTQRLVDHMFQKATRFDLCEERR